MTGKYCKNKSLLYLALACLLLSLSACASTGVISKFSSGEMKNSLPLFDKDAVEETHSVSIPAFYNDNNNWRQLTYEALLFAKIDIVPFEKTEQAIGAGKKKLSLLSPQERADYLGQIGKSLRTDAVINGMVLTKDNRAELVLQLLSSKDSRVLWWQAADFSMKDDTAAEDQQKALLSGMLSTLIQHIGNKKRPVTAPAKHQPKTEEQPKTDTLPKTQKKYKKDIKPAPPVDEIGPM
jgi:hypothetical protein